MPVYWWSTAQVGTVRTCETFAKHRMRVAERVAAEEARLVKLLG